MKCWDGRATIEAVNPSLPVYMAYFALLVPGAAVVATGRIYSHRADQRVVGYRVGVLGLGVAFVLVVPAADRPDGRRRDRHRHAAFQPVDAAQPPAGIERNVGANRVGWAPPTRIARYINQWWAVPTLTSNSITMTALLANIDFEMVPFFVKAVIALTMLGGCALLALIAILAAVKHRPGIAAFAGGLLALGLVLPAGALLSYVSLRSHDVNEPRLIPCIVNHAGNRLGGHGRHQSSCEPVWPRIGILLIIGVAITVFTGLSRRSTTSGEGHARRSWWPVLLVPAMLRVCGAAVFHELCRASSGNLLTPACAPAAASHRWCTSSREEDKMSRKAARLEAKLHRQIAEMDIHELMDLFDAPRIVISAPRKITIPILSNLPKPISLPVKSVTILLAAAESSTRQLSRRDVS